MELAIVIAVVVVALTFDYTNGFHDAANAIATSVSTRALTPRVALILAAVMNFVGALLGQEVAKTVQSVLTIDGVSENHGLVIILSGLVGAISWNLITWYYGLPSSSSHALIGGLVGAGLAGGVTIEWHTILEKVVIPMIASPLVGFAIAFVIMLAIMWIFRRRNPHKVFRGFRMLQTLSAAGLALGHGLQDAQKTMGVIFLAVTTAGYYSASDDGLPLWIVLSAAARDLARHLLRWLADHAHPGPPDHPPRPGPRLLRRDRRHDRPLLDGVHLRGPDLDHPHDHLGDHGRRRHQALLRRPLGRRPLHRHRLGPHLPHGRLRRRARLPRLPVRLPPALSSVSRVVRHLWLVDVAELPAEGDGLPPMSRRPPVAEDAFPIFGRQRPA